MAKKKVLFRVENIGATKVKKHSSLTCNMTDRYEPIKEGVAVSDKKKKMKVRPK
jgi:hypothetical protein